MFERLYSPYIQLGYTPRLGVNKAMDDATLQAILDSLPPKEPRSRLEPYSVLIAELRRRGWSYKDIAQVLAEKCQVKVAPSTIFDFVRVRTKTKPKVKRATVAELSVRSAPEPTRTAASVPCNPTPVVVEDRIAALKQRQVSVKSRKPIFTYQEDEPLTLKPGAKDPA